MGGLGAGMGEREVTADRAIAQGEALIMEGKRVSLLREYTCFCRWL